MSGLASGLLAFALAQADAGAAAGEKPPPAHEEVRAAPEPVPPAPPPTRTPAATETVDGTAARPTPTSTASPTPTSTAAPTPAATPRPPLDPAAAPSRPRRATAPAASAAPATALPAPSPRPPGAEPEREQAVRLARTFLEALAAGNASALADASADRFSFDGDPQAGKDAVRRTWRAVLAGRAGPPPAVNAVEVLPAAEAIARYGKPPARVAALARPGVWVAIGDVGGRPVVLFLASEGGRLAVLGLHD